jgi:hypothetical protein
MTIWMANVERTLLPAALDLRFDLPGCPILSRVLCARSGDFQQTAKRNLGRLIRGTVWADGGHPPLYKLPQLLP